MERKTCDKDQIESEGGKRRKTGPSEQNKTMN